MRWIQRLSIPALALLLVGGSQVAAAEAGKKPFKESPSFGLFRQAEPETARSQALAWLQQSGKTDSATLKSFEQVWSSDKSVLDKVSATFQLGSPEAARLLAEARDPETPAPTAVPKIIKDSKLPRYFRANLGLAYGKALANRKVYEEALDALKAVKPEDVIDPSAYFFHRAVCEHALMYRAEADETIDKLLQDVVDAPERYRQVAWLMHYDMAAWSDKGLDWIARRMNMIKDRLDLTRGGPKTRKMQREVLVKLDEKIKELENKAKCSGGCCNGGNCPSGGQSGGPPNGNRPSNPAGDSGLPTGIARGDVDQKRVKEIAESWGNLPEKQRPQARADMTRTMPAKYREAIETYLKRVGNAGEK